jgi:hypothetical protein
MFDLPVNIECSPGEGAELGAGSSGTPQARPSETSMLSSGAPANPGGELACTHNISESGEESPWPKPAPPEKKRHHASPVEKGRNWLLGEPYGWIGRKVRNRSNASIYTVRQIFKNGRVQLERNWMSYSTDVQTIRIKYDPHS